MACYHPRTAWRSNMINPDTGKSGLVFNWRPGIDRDTELQIACGQCIGCRLERSRQWAIRCIHEASLSENNCFITLTFDDQNLYKRKKPWSIDVRDFQLFMKKLRFEYGSGIRFFHCGEYGEICKQCMQSKRYCSCGPTSDSEWKKRVRPGRPHYHACLFNFDFPDRQLFRIDSNTGHRHYTSESLARLWPYGFHDIGDVTFQSAAYVARYITKKINGEAQEDHYHQVDTITGEAYDIKPEYITMSRRPGIGANWLEIYKEDVYPKDFVTHDGVKFRPPRFYDRQLEKEDPELLETLKQQRKEAGVKWADNNTPDRLETREKLQKRRADKLVRSIE